QCGNIIRGPQPSHHPGVVGKVRLSEGDAVMPGAPVTRREFLAATPLLFPPPLWGRVRVGGEQAADPYAGKALIAITLDLEMSRNFPRWEDTHWDYEKGNLNEETKRYTV